MGDKQTIPHTCRYCGEDYVEEIVDGWTERAHTCTAERLRGRVAELEAEVNTARAAARTCAGADLDSQERAEKAERERDEARADVERLKIRLDISADCIMGEYI